MPRVVPSQVVKYIDRSFSGYRSPDDSVHEGYAAQVAGRPSFRDVNRDGIWRARSCSSSLGNRSQLRARWRCARRQAQIPER